MAVENHRTRPTAQPGALAGTQPAMSRILGGSQLTGPFSGPKGVANEGCETALCTLSDGSEGCTIGSPPMCVAPSPEEPLYRVLKIYFSGTPAASTFGAPIRGTNNGSSFFNAPIDYLQIWWADILYASGLGNCKTEDLMSSPPNIAGCQETKMPKYKHMTAQEMLEAASDHIPTKPVTPPLFGYSGPSGVLGLRCQCASGYVTRNAFQGDFVCASPAQRSQAAADNDSATIKKRYSTDDSDGVPYGKCGGSWVWRQAIWAITYA
jgi:hypothetical protein